MADAAGLVCFEIEKHLSNYRLTGNGAHVWRAWRCARHLDELPSDFQAEFFQFFDEVAKGMVHSETVTGVAQAARMSSPSGARGEGNLSVAEQEADRRLYLRFRQILANQGARKNKSEAHRELAKILGKSVGAVKQQILRLEGAGQYATRSRNKW